MELIIGPFTDDVFVYLEEPDIGLPKWILKSIEILRSVLWI